MDSSNACFLIWQRCLLVEHWPQSSLTRLLTFILSLLALSAYAYAPASGHVPPDEPSLRAVNYPDAVAAKGVVNVFLPKDVSEMPNCDEDRNLASLCRISAAPLVLGQTRKSIIPCTPFRRLAAFEAGPIAPARSSGAGWCGTCLRRTAVESPEGKHYRTDPFTATKHCCPK
jgi:hypothetical protein